ncbi:MAG TPA: S41 family peptidase [Burkholderiaceae bacterium]|nr:S41 family peptidase [Burkholderiaceae bacterium]
MSITSRLPRRVVLCVLTSIALAACGGDGDSTNLPTIGGGGVSRSPSPSTGTDGGSCSVANQKSFVRAHLNDVYLWYDEIPNVDPNSKPTAAQYFDSLLVKSKDRFSFTIPQADADALLLSGQNVSYGAEYKFDAQSRLRIAYSDAGSPAAQNGIDRGDEIVSINGTPVSALNANQLNAGLFPSAAGASATFGIRDLGQSSVRNVTLAATTVVKDPVPISNVFTAADGKKVGYLVFNDHLATAEQPLYNVMSMFQAQGVQDLVLDVRYNGGGFIYIASELAYMIGGGSLNGRVFERLRFNNKHPEKNADVPFYNTSTTGLPLPQLGLSRVFVLTGSGTCSASESIINGLSPFVQVITIGGATCGKPYGFLQKNNCGQAYFAIEFEGVNDIGAGGYVNGFAPTCASRDDFDRALGDPTERLLAGALSYRINGDCSGVPTGYAKALGASGEIPSPELARPHAGIRVLR